MHNIIRPNTQPGIVTPTQERCGLEAQEAQLEKMVGALVVKEMVRALLSPVWGNGGQRQMIFWSLDLVVRALVTIGWGTGLEQIVY